MLESLSPVPRDFYRYRNLSMNRPSLPELTLQDGDLFGAAMLIPAFASDLSTWTVTIHKHGLLTQTVLISQPPTFEGHIATLRQHVPAKQLENLKRIVHDDFMLTFSDFPSIAMTDQQTTRLVVRMHGKTNVIDAYGAHAIAMLGTDADRKKAEKYCRLWDAIVDLAPFTPYTD
ncbi:hypothetical protein [Roseiconus lacunae]|uniref:hypothetical protein n=2 Tax=Roseiconus lacunae TaxID=2605694 RepID=UPI00135C02FF|nr:hypothetical protein [Roseiconus lacunae]